MLLEPGLAAFEDEVGGFDELPHHGDELASEARRAGKCGA
jgi:hypothetical protein